MRLLPLCPCALLLAAACIVEAPVGDKPSSSSSPERPRALPDSSPVSIKLGANLEDKVEIVGTQLVPGQVAPGEQTRVTILFKALEELPQDYLVFVHVEDVDGRMERVNLDHRPASGQYPTSRWKKGELVKDEFVLYIPPDAPVRGLNLWGGLWEPRSDNRLRLKNAEVVRSDGNNRVLLAQVPVVR